MMPGLLIRLISLNALFNISMGALWIGEFENTDIVITTFA